MAGGTQSHSPANAQISEMVRRRFRRTAAKHSPLSRPDLRLTAHSDGGLWHRPIPLPGTAIGMDSMAPPGI